VRDVLLGHSPLARISHTDYVLITIEAAVAAQACGIARGLASIVMPAAGFAIRIPAERLHWHLKVLTAAHSGGAS
jgi:uncharacterized membrane protein YeiH